MLRAAAAAIAATSKVLRFEPQPFEPRAKFALRLIDRAYTGIRQGVQSTVS